MEPEIIEGSKLNIQLSPISNQHYALDVEVKLDEDLVQQLKNHQCVMLAVECRSGMDTQNFRTLKSEILNLAFELKQRHVKELNLFWNDKMYEILTLPNKQIADIIDKIALDGQKNADKQFSYIQTLVSIRHHITDISKNLTNKHDLAIIFISTQISISSLIDSSWEQQYMKWLYGRNLHKQDINLQSNKLRNKLWSLPCSNVIYTVGIGKYHDSQLLQRMSSLSRNRGIYQLSTSMNHLKQILSNLCIIASGQISSISLLLKQNRNEINSNVFSFYLTSDQNCRVFRRKQGIEFIKKQNGQHIINYAEHYHGDFVGIDHNRFNVNIIQRMLGDKLQYLKFKCYYMQFLLRQIMQDTNEVIEIERQKDITDNNKYIYVQRFNEVLLNVLIGKMTGIKVIFDEAQGMIKMEKMGKKAEFIQKLDYIRDLILKVEQMFANIYKLKFSYLEIGQLIGQVSKTTIKRSLKKKLLKRINANPNLLAQVYDSIRDNLQKMNYIQLDTKYSHYLKQVGYCQYTGNNFVKAMFEQDCLGIPFVMHRPKAAIADPGRITIQGVYYEPVSVANFMSDKRMRQNIHKQIKGNQNQIETYFNWNTGLEWKIMNNRVVYFTNQKYIVKQQINELNTYDDFRTHQVLGIMPLYICQQNWSIAKSLIKPALGFSICDQPLAYTTSQLQIVPFMLLQRLICMSQTLKYSLQKSDSQIDKFLERRKKIQQVYKSLDTVLVKQDITPEIQQVLFTYMSQNKFNRLKLKQIREEIRNDLQEHNQQKLQIKAKLLNQYKATIDTNERVLKLIEQTCQRIIAQHSGVYTEIPFNKAIVEKYYDYENPINRTVDVIPNNQAFIAQIYCIIKNEGMVKPTQQNFHYFFQRLVQQQLRRRTDGWKQEYVQDSFVNKLLNVEIQKIDHPTVVVLGSSYKQKFQAAKRGENLKMNEITERRKQFDLNIKKQDTFNITQRMTLIQYKRLYETVPLQFWYTRFRLYGQLEQKYIHKWKSIGILNSYNIFTLVIQNKTQRKNAKRREVIEAGNYVDPFNYQACVDFIQQSFYNLRQKVIRRNMQQAVARVFNSQVQAFAQTPDPIEAAGVLIGNTIGLMYEKSPPIIHLKLNMLLSGHFQGLQLFTHKQGWIMSKNKMTQLAQKYPDQFSKYKYMM